MDHLTLPTAYASNDAPKKHPTVDGGIHTWKRFLADLGAADPETNEGRAELIEQIGLGLGARSVSLFLYEENEEHELSKSMLVWSANQGCVSQQLSQDEINRLLQVLDSGAPLTIDTTKMERVVWLPLKAGRHKAFGAIEIRKDGELPNYTSLMAINELVETSFHHARQIRRLRENVKALETIQGQLIASRNTLRALFDSSPASIYIIDLDYTLMAVNMSQADLAQRSPKVLVGEKCYNALYKRKTPCPDCLVWETMNTGETTRRLEKRWGDDGINREFEISTFPIKNDAGQIHQAFLFEEDVTERQQLQASLAQSEKLAAVGQLAAGVAHEINNPLTTILANAQLLQRKIPQQDAELQEMLELIIQGSDRASQAVRALLDFSRRERYERAPVDLNQTIQRTVRFLRHELNSRSITLDFEAAPNLPKVVASQDHLQSVWLNLILNSIDAIYPDPGRIQITTCQIDEQVQIAISDDGQGIRSEHIQRVFEPFFTTKEISHGTGLGLAVCHQIVSRHGGQIFVSSKLGEGTTFTIHLPLN